MLTGCIYTIPIQRSTVRSSRRYSQSNGADVRLGGPLPARTDGRRCRMLCTPITLLFATHNDTNNNNVWFLARDSIYAIARYMPSPVRLSVCLSICPSVTRVDQSKTFELRITQPSPQSSSMTLVCWCLISRRNSKGKIGSGGAE